VQTFEFESFGGIHTDILTFLCRIYIKVVTVLQFSVVGSDFSIYLSISLLSICPGRLTAVINLSCIMFRTGRVVLMPTACDCADVASPLLNDRLRDMSSFIKGK